MHHFLRKAILMPFAAINFLTLKAHRARVGINCTINGCLGLYGKGRLELGDDVRINSLYRLNPIGGNRSTSIYIGKGAVVQIGNGTGISNVALFAAKQITIGKNVRIGGDVSIYDTDFHSLDYLERRKPVEGGVIVKPVTIGDDVFVGAHSIVLKGVNIGTRSIIGAGSVVTGDVPPDEVWAGAPARCVRKLG